MITLAVIAAIISLFTGWSWLLMFAVGFGAVGVILNLRPDENGKKWQYW